MSQLAPAGSKTSSSHVSLGLRTHWPQPQRKLTVIGLIALE